MKKLAFTLAEVLITLTIIGVIAALTLPSITSSIEETELITEAKKAHNTLQNAIKLKYLKTNTEPNLDVETFASYLGGGDPVLNILENNNTTITTSDGQVITAKAGTNEIIVAVDINGADGPNSYGTISGDGITAFTPNNMGDPASVYNSAKRDIVHFSVKGINVAPHPDSATAQMYIRGIK